MLVFLSTDLAFWGERAKANPISVSEHRACPTMIKISATLNIRLYQQNLILVVMYSVFLFGVYRSIIGLSFSDVSFSDQLPK